MTQRWKGSIWIGSQEDFDFLKGLGVDWLDPVDIDGECTVEMSEEVFKKVEPHWGRFVWTLTPFEPTDPISKGEGT